MEEEEKEEKREERIRGGRKGEGRKQCVLPGKGPVYFLCAHIHIIGMCDQTITLLGSHSRKKKKSLCSYKNLYICV